MGARNAPATFVLRRLTYGRLFHHHAAVRSPAGRWSNLAVSMGGRMKKSTEWQRLQGEWAILSYYQRFESTVALVLTLVVGLVILVALYRLTTSVVVGLVVGVLDPLDHNVFQKVFGEVLTL